MTQEDFLRVFKTREKVKAYYNKIARFYDLLAERTERPMRELGLELLAAARNEHVLEIGFGTGHSLVELARAVGPHGRVYGVDISENMLRLTEELLEREDLVERVELRCGDAAKLPYGNESLDGIFMSFTLELFDTPEIPKVLRECRRVLRLNGRIVVVGVSKENPSDPAVVAFEWTHRHFPNLLDCRPIHVRQALQNAGFTIKDTLLEHMWVPVEIVLGTKLP